MVRQKKSLGVIWRAEKMDNNHTPPPEVTEANLLEIVRTLRTDVGRQEQLLQQVLAILQQYDLRPLETLSSPSTFLPVWVPEEGAYVIDDLNGLLPKVRQIGKGHDNPQDHFARLKATAMGRYYVSHLKQYPIVRALVSWIWRNCYPVYVNSIAIQFRNREAKRWRPMIKLSEFVKKSGTPTTQVVDAAIVETPAPKVFPSVDQGYLEKPHDHYNFPHIYVATISGGMIYGGTNLVLTKDEVIYHDLYDFKCDYTSEELHGRKLIDPDKSRIRWLVHDELPAHLPAAAVFVDACASNYAHWLTEVLPRIAAFCAAEQFKDIPIVVNDGLHKNIMESLFLMAGPEREIVTLPIGSALHVAALYLTSVAGYVPFEPRNNKILGNSHGVFSPHAFDLIRTQASSYAGKLPQQAWPEKIYLRRNSGARKVTNAAELEELLINHGFVIVEPEKLTFLQQFLLFSHTKVVVGSSGAALANIMFSSSEAKIFILISKFQNTSYWYWQNIACASGKVVNYVFGDAVEGQTNGIHADFKIDVQNLKEALSQYE